jgi:peptide/nickel transport system permease protein
MNWWKYALGRIATAGATLWVGLTTLFLTLYATPLNPVDAIFGRPVYDPGAKRQLAVQLGLRGPDGRAVPLWEQYLDFLGGLLAPGQSVAIERGIPAAELVLEHAPATLWLAFWSVVVALGMWIPLGIYAGAKAGTWRGRLAAGFGTFQRSVPTFWLAVVVAGVFGGSVYFGDGATQLGGVFAGVAPFGAPGLEWVWIPLPDPVPFLEALAWTLPAAAVVASTALAGGIHLGRRGTREGLDSGYADLARAKGVSEPGVLRSHVGANLGRSLVADLPRYGASLVVGLVFVERIFGIGGLGNLLIAAGFNSDLPVVEATAGVFLATLVALSLLADLLVAWLDPRGAAMVADDEVIRPRPNVRSRSRHHDPSGRPPTCRYGRSTARRR